MLIAQLAARDALRVGQILDWHHVFDKLFGRKVEHVVAAHIHGRLVGAQVNNTRHEVRRIAAGHAEHLDTRTQEETKKKPTTNIQIKFNYFDYPIADLYICT